MIYSTYIGGGTAYDMAIDAGGNAYITGSTLSETFPITPGAAQTTCARCIQGVSDAFITKLNATGTALVYSTYLGGSGGESGRGIAVNAAGNAYVTGATGSGSGSSVLFPTTPGAYQTTSPGAPDVFVTKVNPTGTAFVYSTFLGGDVTDQALGIAIDPSGNAHVTGQTRSRNFPLVLPFQSSCTINGPCVFISSLNPTGSALTFSTYFGQGEGLELVADTTGSIYVTGEIFDGLTTLPTMNAIQPAKPGYGDAFVAKIEVQRIQMCKPVYDFDGDGKTDVGVYRPESGIWYLENSQTGFYGVQFGIPTDKPVVGDYDGDCRSDVAVYRPSDGVWYLLQSRDGFYSVQFGTPTDLPVPGDYDGDGKTDVAVFRPETNAWYQQRSTAGFNGFFFGSTGDKPVPNSFVP